MQGQITNFSAEFKTAKDKMRIVNQARVEKKRDNAHGTFRQHTCEFGKQEKCGFNTIATTIMALLFMCGILGLQTGCTKAVSSSTFYGSTGWDSTETPSIPGIAHANIQWYCRGDKLIYVVWTDLKHGGTGVGSSGSASSGTYQHDSQFVNSQGDLLFGFSYTEDVSEGAVVSSGTITVNNTRYDLNEGSLLLVSTHGGQPNVKQLELDSEAIQLLQSESPGKDITTIFRSVASENADIRSFFDTAMSSDQPKH